MLTSKNKLNNNLKQNQGLQMQEEVVKQNKKICSIEYLKNQLSNEEMLLTSQNKYNTIMEESQDQLFDLYITPFQQKQEQCHLHLLHSDDHTLFQSRKKDEASIQLYQLGQNQDSVRLKAIIDKKNRTIDQVTEQLKNLSQQVKRLNKIIKKQELRNNKTQKGKNLNEEIHFLQKNNLQLFEQLCKCRKQKDSLQKDLQMSQDKVNQLKEALKQIEKKNKELMKQNSCLLDRTKQFLTESQKEMKYLSKIKDIFYQKTGIQDYYPMQSYSFKSSHVHSKQNLKNAKGDHNTAKQASLKAFLFDKSNNTYRKESSPQRLKQSNHNLTNIKPKQRDRATGSLDVERYSKSERCSNKNSKVLDLQRQSKKLNNLL